MDEEIEEIEEPKPPGFTTYTAFAMLAVAALIAAIIMIVLTLQPYFTPSKVGETPGKALMKKAMLEDPTSPLAPMGWGMSIYVRGLALDVTEAKLQEAFEKHGEVKNVLIERDKTTSESRGFGFIEMANQVEAAAAINALHGTELQGKTLKLKGVPAQAVEKPEAEEEAAPEE